MKLLTIIGSALLITLSQGSENKSPNQEQSPAKEESKQALSKHDHTSLDRFEMGEMKFDGLDFKQAMNKLMVKYKAICADTGEQALKTSLNITGSPKSKPSLLLRGNFNYILSQLCTLYGMEMKTKNNEYKFTTIPSQGKEIVLTLNVPLEVEKICSVTDLRKLFNATISHNKVKATMTIKGQESDLKKFRTYIKKLTDSKQLQIKTFAKIIRLSNDNISNELKKTIEAGKHLTEESLMLMMRELAQSRDTDIMTTPSIVSLFGKSAIIELIREPKLVDKETDIWIGLRYGITTDYSGLYLKTDLEYEYRHTDGTDPLLLKDLKGLKLDETTKIQCHKTSHNFKLKPGMSAILKVNSPANKKNTTDYIVITHSIIDATGQPVFTLQR